MGWLGGLWKGSDEMEGVAVTREWRWRRCVRGWVIDGVKERPWFTPDGWDGQALCRLVRTLDERLCKYGWSMIESWQCRGHSSSSAVCLRTQNGSDSTAEIHESRPSQTIAPDSV